MQSFSCDFQKHQTGINVRSRYSLPAPRLEYASKHITFAGLKIWNGIPNRIKQIKFYSSFSKTLQAHITIQD